jgi:hypothetical protein
MRSNAEQLAATLDALGELRDHVVLVGGAATELLITDPAASPIRFTDDVDVVVEQTAVGLHRIESRLRELDFTQRPDLDPICRWRRGELVLDVMPIDQKIFGFSNRWYPLAWQTADVQRVAGHLIRVVKPVVFIATKLEAWASRGGGDFQASHDLEDIIAVVDGRSELTDEIEHAAPDLRAYLAERLGALIDDHRFVDAIAGHLPPDDASQDRHPLVLGRLRVLAQR